MRGRFLCFGGSSTLRLLPVEASRTVLVAESLVSEGVACLRGSSSVDRAESVFRFARNGCSCLSATCDSSLDLDNLIANLLRHRVSSRRVEQADGEHSHRDKKDH